MRHFLIGLWLICFVKFVTASTNPLTKRTENYKTIHAPWQNNDNWLPLSFLFEQSVFPEVTLDSLYSALNQLQLSSRKVYVTYPQVLRGALKGEITDAHLNYLLCGEYLRHADYVAAFNHCKQVMANLKSLPDDWKKAHAAAIYADLWLMAGYPDSAAYYTGQCMALAKQTNDVRSIAIANFQKGELVNYFQDFNVADNYYFEASRLSNLTGFGSLYTVSSIKHGHSMCLYGRYHGTLDALATLASHIHINSNEDVQVRYYCLQAWAWTGVGDLRKGLVYLDSLSNYNLYDDQYQVLLEQIKNSLVKGIRYKSPEGHVDTALLQRFKNLFNQLDGEKYHIELMRTIQSNELSTASIEAQSRIEILNKNVRKYSGLSILCGVALIWLFLLLLGSENKRRVLRRELNSHINRIDILNQKIYLNLQSSLWEQNQPRIDQQLDIADIQKILKIKLNKTQIAILTIIYNYPTIGNDELAEQIHISKEGLRSSLRKLYDLFNIDKKHKNKRLALVIAAKRASPNTTSDLFQSDTTNGLT